MKDWLNNKSEIDLRWLYLKTALAFYWIANLVGMMWTSTSYSYAPIGICRYINLTALFTRDGKIGLTITIVVLAMLYIREMNMKVVTLLQFIASVIIISYHESNGQFHHATPYSVIFAVQSIAYWLYFFKKTFDLKQFRVQYSLQIIVAIYMLASISKVISSGAEWINNSDLFSIQIIKNYSFVYFAHGEKSALEDGYRLAYSMLNHSLFVKTILSLALLLELFSFIALFNERIRMGYALCLLLMHSGIKVIMAIPFGVIAPIMLIFFLNPLFLLHSLINKIGKIRAPVLILFVLLTLGSCKQQKPKTSIITIPSITKEKLLGSETAADKNTIAMAIQLGEFLPADTNCSYTDTLRPRKTFNFSSIESCFKNSNELTVLRELNKVLYELIAEERHPTENTTNIANTEIKTLFDSLATGSWTYMCDGHTDVAIRFVQQYAGTRFIALNAKIPLDQSENEQHILALVYFKKNNQWYGSVFDCQNGMIGPISISGDSIPSLQVLTKNPSSFAIAFLPDSILHHKRVLMNEPLPCNLFPEQHVQYCIADSSSGYRMERIAYSQVYYTWFLKKKANWEYFQNTIVKTLIANTPQR